MLSNANICHDFLSFHQAKNKNLRSTGKQLFSYNLCIAEWTPRKGPLDRPLTIFDFTAKSKNFISQTTARHVNLLVATATKLCIPFELVRENLPY